MANLRTTTDCLMDALWKASEPMSNASEYYDQGLAYLNRCYQEICSGGSMLDVELDEQWWWLRKATPGVLTLLPAVVLPTVTVTQGSTAIVYSTPPIDPVTGLVISTAGFMFQLNGTGNGDIYRIASHVANFTSATLDQPYISASGSGLKQRSIKFQYQLATDVKSIIGRMRAFQMGRREIDYCDVDPMRTRFPLDQLPMGIPINFAMVQEQVCEFSHYVGDDPSLACRVEYDYIMVPPDLVDDNGVSSPLLPFQYRSIIADETAAMILADKQDTAAQIYEGAAKARLQAMAKENRRRQVQSSNTVGKIMPRQSDVARQDGPLRTSSGMIIG